MSVSSGRKFSLLPMLGHTKGKRSAVTCALKCDNACTGEVCNTSSNSYFRDIASATMSRRAALGFGAAGALAVAFGSALTSPESAVAGGPGLSPAAKNGYGASKLKFTAIAPVDAAVDAVTVPEGFTWQPVIRWGDPIFNDAPDFDLGNQTAAAQARQFGYNNDYTDILEIPGSKGRRAVLFANHEYTNEAIMFPASMPAADVRKVGAAAHGLTVVELERKNKNAPWSYVKGAGLNRRYLNDTAYELTGPVAGSPLVRTAADPSGRRILGTLGNCAGGTTPWGTILSGEENFNGYFVAPGTSAEDKRYGLTNKPTARQWELDDPRFDTRNPGYANEANRFGWIVEVDPFDPTSTPKKHSSLGRFKHEGANVIVAESGHVVAYSGDDERFDYLYKFVSKDKYRRGGPEAQHDPALRRRPLRGPVHRQLPGPRDHRHRHGAGRRRLRRHRRVAAARRRRGLEGARDVRRGGAGLHAPGRGQGGPHQDGPLRGRRAQPAHRQGLRRLHQQLGPRQDRQGRRHRGQPAQRQPRRPHRRNHRDRRPDLHRVHLEPADGLRRSPSGDVTYFSGFPVDQVSPISCPDNLAFDSVGNLWISTDGAPSGIGKADGLFKVTLDGAERGRVEQFLAVPRDGETCGPIIHDEERTVFVSVQHPGEDGTFDAQLSFFPDYVPAGTTPARGQARAPRPSVVQVFRTDD